jgi:hypothetical protein
MNARFPGKDARTGAPIKVGDEITRYRGGWTISGPPASFGGFAWTPRPDYSAAAHGRRYDEINRTIGRMAADEFDDAATERARDDAEYAAGIEDARRESFNRNTFGESYAAAEEYARDLRGLNGEW